MDAKQYKRRAREITDLYRERWEGVRDETSITDIWAFEDDWHAEEIAAAMADAYKEGLRKAASIVKDSDWGGFGSGSAASAYYMIMDEAKDIDA